MKAARTAPQVVLRLPADLKEWLAKQAETNRRSLNGELIFRLERQREADERHLA